ncbi:MAG: undecaprenyl-diphosphatase UppP [Oscillospiraceae bacterium]|nr:undecaprenyl-diphosphatase UppP [Oscillospiraceae bacterium]
MTLVHAIILGIVQGLTELLPISSSAHLTLIPWAFHWGDIPDSFDVALHFGTLLAIGIFFFKDWINLLKGGYKKFIKKEDNPEGKMLLYIIIATLPGGIIGVILEKYAQEVLSKPIIIAIALIVMGIVLYVIDKISKSKTEYKDISLKQGLLIGTSQALAFIPGVSRSGITMTIARALGIKRESAARFSFMLSAPIVLGACILTFSKFEFSRNAIIGILVSFIVGIVVIKFLLEYLKRGSFKVFAIYRIIIGIIVLICALIWH